MSNCNPIDTPIKKDKNLNLAMCPKTSQEREVMSKVPYSTVVRSLMYAMMCTRLDIYYAIGLISWYQSNPGNGHWKAVERVLRYLKEIVDHCLCY